MRNTDLDWDDQYDYSPNEMARLSYTNPLEYDKIMAQNVGDYHDIQKFYRDNLERAQEVLAQQRLNRK